ncbi:MAG: indolepyruvate ferredoxin oxidoreductase subunit alpha, partial [Desulfamplus sp.]|nr:indolepyruvate ferredoxin oxidoreductase subunit alpha [Desulfamplus sp.]
RNHREVKVIEELDNVTEKEVKCIAFEENINVKISGKTESEDWVGEYTPDKVYEAIRKTWPDLLPEKKHDESMPQVSLRQAQMCPGCGHRSAFYAIKKALAATDITVADIGCHTLGFLPPYETGQLLMCMGASTGMGAGLSLFNKSRKVIAFLGDSTFFHAGLPGIINAVFNRHPVTLVVMENGTTAMTGHQDHAASGRNFNEITEAIPVRQVLEGVGVKHIFETDTYKQSMLISLVKKAMQIDEFSVVIAKHPCMLKLTREQRRKESYVHRQVAINPDKCQNVYECIERFGCPTFTKKTDGRIAINKDLCIGDGSCIQTCPRNAVEPAAKA